jgi:hypothetical protein
VQWVTKGANTIGEVQGSINGVQFADIQALAAGLNVNQTPREAQLRIKLTNESLISPETNVLAVLVEYDVTMASALSEFVAYTKTTEPAFVDVGAVGVAITPHGVSTFSLAAAGAVSVGISPHAAACYSFTGLGSLAFGITLTNETAITKVAAGAVTAAITPHATYAFIDV